MEEIKNKCLELKASDEDNPSDIHLESTKTDCEDNEKETVAEFQVDIPKKESCIGEEETKTSEDEIAILFENVPEKNDEVIFQNLGVPKEENTNIDVKADDSEIQEVVITEDKEDIKDESSVPFGRVSVDSENVSTHLQADLQPERTEVRHRNVPEKIQNIEEIPTDQLRDETKDAIGEKSTTDAGRTDQVEEIIFSNVGNRELKDQQISQEST